LVANQLLLQGVIGSGVLLSPQGNRLLRVLSQRRAVVPHQCPLEDNGVQTQIKRLRPHLVNWANNNYQTKIAQGATPKSPKVNQERVPVMPNSESAPLWLLRLHAIHRNSSIVAFLLVAATLVVYGWTVYSQELWSQAYHKLQNLRREERQLTTTSEVLQNKMAQEGEKPSAGLVAPTPDRTIFVLPAPHNLNSMPTLGEAMPSTTTPNSQTQQQSASGLGY
jgi:hypothetical protein